MTYPGSDQPDPHGPGPQQPPPPQQPGQPYPTQPFQVPPQFSQQPGYQPYGSQPTDPLPTQVPPAPKRKVSRTAVIIAGVVVAACCGGGALIGALNSHPTAKTNTNVGAAPATTQPAPPAEHAKPATPSVAQLATAWWSSGGRDKTDALQGDMQHAGTAATNQDLSALHDACASMQTDTEAAQAYAPFPDAEGQKLWAAGLAAEARAATDCVGGLDTNSADLIQRATGEISEAGTDLEQLAARVTALR